MYVFVKDTNIDTCKYVHILTIRTYVQDMYNVQMYVLDSIFGRICHPFLKYEQNTYTCEQHGSLMLTGPEHDLS